MTIADVYVIVRCGRGFSRWCRETLMYGRAGQRCLRCSGLVRELSAEEEAAYLMGGADALPRVGA